MKESTMDDQSTQQTPAPMSTHTKRRYKKYGKWEGIRKCCGLPGSFWGYIISVDLWADYRRHLVWSKKDGDKLLQHVTARFQSTAVLMSLFVAATLAVLFSPAEVVGQVRHAMGGEELWSIKFWTGVWLCVSFVVSLGALIANITAWSIFTVLSKENAPIILRSSVGLYSAHLPSRLVMVAIYIFFGWAAMFWFILLPWPAALILTIIGLAVLGHIASTYSAMGQVIMATGAMSHDRILPVEEEEMMLPRELYHVLLHEHDLAMKARIPVNRQYRVNYREQLWQQDV